MSQSIRERPIRDRTSATPFSNSQYGRRSHQAAPSGGNASTLIRQLDGRKKRKMRKEKKRLGNCHSPGRWVATFASSHRILSLLSFLSAEVLFLGSNNPTRLEVSVPHRLKPGLQTWRTHGVPPSCGRNPKCELLRNLRRTEEPYPRWSRRREGRARGTERQAQSTRCQVPSSSPRALRRAPHPTPMAELAGTPTGMVGRSSSPLRPGSSYGQEAEPEAAEP